VMAAEDALKAKGRGGNNGGHDGEGVDNRESGGDDSPSTSYQEDQNYVT
jgi:hypothetical protein